MVIVVMGVSGCGKTTVGRLLAAALRLPFYDADDFHPLANVEKMRSGVPLTDADRVPWLTALAEEIHRWDAERGAVLACSALRQAYREILAGGGDVRFVFLKGTKETIARRLAARGDHFMPADLLDSQFEALEQPAEGLAVDIGPSPEEIVESIVQNLRG